jgi:hypothetical protein
VKSRPSIVVIEQSASAKATLTPNVDPVSEIKVFTAGKIRFYSFSVLIIDIVFVRLFKAAIFTSDSTSRSSWLKD